LETKFFLEGVLADEGNYCVFAFRTKDDYRTQKFYGSIDEVIEAAQELDAKGYDAYFALATFEEPNSRKVANVKYLKSLFLDLDCGPSKDYSTQGDAIAALRKFCEVLSLPRPIIINSGRGIHVYWVLSEQIPLDDWLPVAEKLKKLCVDNNLLADVAVTADAARVLRVPTTHNHKNDPPTQVNFLGSATPDPVNFDAFSELLGGEGVTPPKRFTGTGTPFIEPINTENRFIDILQKTFNGTGCEQLRQIAEDQANCTEPLWRAGLSIAKYCVDVDKAAHIISKKHPDYTMEATQKKIDLIKGPYNCNTFDEFKAGICTECPNWGEIKSPILLGRRVREATEEDNIIEAPAASLPDTPINKYVIPTYPRPYFRGANGGVYIRSVTKSGDPDEKLVYHNDLYVVRRLEDVELGEAIVMRLHLPKDGVREFTLPLSAVTSREEFRKHMSMKGVAITRMDELMTYTTTWVNELQANSTADEAHRQFGWTSEECTSFVLGNQEIFKDRVEFNPPSNQTMGLFPAFEPKGTLEDWKNAINFYNRDGFELHQFVVGTSFGSPLMQFSSVNCAGMHIYSKDTGVGKTTALASAISVWGKPEDLIMHERDTYNTKMNRGEVYHNLPLYMDELTNAKPQELSNLAYQLTGGRQRGRMASGSNTERHRGEAWSLLAVTTGNTSIVERISMFKQMPKAEAQRIFECRVDKMHFETKKETDDFSQAIENNYGYAGKVYIQYLMDHLEDAKKLLVEIQAKIDGRANLTAENRFWSVLVAATITGLVLARRAGLIDFDTKKITKWALEQLTENKRQVEDMNSSVEVLLNDYITDHWNNVLWIKSTEDRRTGEPNQGDTVVIPEMMARGKLVARYETDRKRAYLILKPLKAWCGEQQINYGAFVHDLKSKLGAKKSKVRLAKGTHMNLPPTDVLVVDCSIEKIDGPGDITDV
jgi:hypothetical protein